MIFSNSGSRPISFCHRFLKLFVLVFGLGLAQFSAACIDIVSSPPTVTEGGAVQIDVAYDFSSPSCGTLLASETVTVDYTTVDNTALANSDYTPEVGTLVFDDINQTLPLSINLSTINDTTSEPIENFELVLTSATGPFGALPIGNGIQSITIEDNEFAAIEINPVGPFSGSEGSSVAFTAEVVRGNPNTVCTFDVDLVFFSGVGRASANDVGTPTPQPITLAFGQSQTISIPLLSDFLLEGTETFNFGLDNPSAGCFIGSVGQSVSIIDIPPPATVQFDSASLAATLIEGGSGTLQIEMTAGNQDCEVDVAISGGTAVPNSDFTNISLTDLLVTPAGLQIPIDALTDIVNDPNETYTVQLSPAFSGGASVPACDVVASNSASTVTITDVPPRAGFSVLSETVTEGATTVSLQVSELSGLSGVGSCDVDVFTVPGSGNATSGLDYLPLSATTISVPIAGSVLVPAITVLTDSVSPEAETFSVEIVPSAGSSNPCAVTVDNIATVEINDVAARIAEFTAASVAQTLSEGDQLGFRITLTSGIGNCEVTISSGAGTATAPGDFSPFTPVTTLVPTNELPINAGITNLDSLVEGTETITYVMEPGPGINFPACAVGPNDTVTIMLDDTLPVVDVIPGSVNTSVDETNSVATIAVALSAGVGPASVTVTTADISATANADYSSLPAGFTVSFPNTATVGSTEFFDIPILGDAITELDESFTATISGNTGTLVGVDTATVTINDVIPSAEFWVASEVVSEGATTVSLQLREVSGLSGTASCDVLVSTSSAGNATATPGVDYVPLSSVAVSIPLGGSVLVPPISILTDAVTPESPNENFFLDIVPGNTATPCEVDPARNFFAVVEIVDVVPPVVETVQFDSTSLTATLAEGGAGTLQIEMIAGSASCELDVAISGGTASVNSDYTDVTVQGLEVLPGGVPLAIDALSDNMVEVSETYTIQLSPGVSGLTSFGPCDVASNDTSTVTITDVSPTVEFSASSSTASGVEGSIVGLELVLISGTGPASVEVTTSDGSAIAPGDYTAVTAQTFSFPSNAVVGDVITVPITLATDTLNEGNEDFQVFLAPGTGTNLGTNDSSTVVITDDPVSIVEFNAASVTTTITEGANDSLLIDLVTGTGDCGVLIQTVDGSATSISPSVDFTSAASVISGGFNASGETFAVNALFDIDLEGAESYTVVLSPDAGSSIVPPCLIGPADTATVNIIDVEPAIVEFSSSSTVVSGVEGTSLVVDVELVSGQLAATVVVDSVDGSATAPGDYTAIVGQTVSFPAGSAAGSTQQISIPLISDGIGDSPPASPELFTLELSLVAGDPNGTILGSNAVAMLEIFDPGQPVAQWTAASLNTAGMEGTSVTLDIELVAGDGPATIGVFTADVTATSPADYTGFNTTVFNFPPGSTVGDTIQVTIPLADEGVFEGIETFNVVLEPLFANTSSNDVATVSITEQAQPTVQFTAATTSVSGVEGSIVNLELELLAANGPASVQLSTTDGTAQAPGDYTGVSAQTFLFPASAVIGDTLIVPIQLATDTLTEVSEDFMVVLAPGAGTILGANDEATVFITDDPVPTIEFSSTSTAASAPEDAGSVTLTLEMTAGNGPGSVFVSTADVSATDAADYTALVAGFTVSFPASAVVGSTETITIPVLSDNDVEGTEVFTANITGTSSANAGVNAVSTVSILDVVIPTVQFSATSISASGVEGSTVNLELELLAGTGPASVSVSTGGGSAIAPGDYTAIVAQTFSFPSTAVAGDMINVPITLAMDTLTEGSEDFLVTLTAGATTMLGANDESMVFITDDPVPSIEFASASTAVSTPEDGGSVSLTLEMTAGSGPGTVFVSTADGSATDTEDYNALAGGSTVSFPPTAVVGSTETITIPILSDTDVEGIETFTANITGTSTANAGVNAVSTVSITDSTPVPAVVQFAAASTAITVNENGVSPSLTVVITGGQAPASVEITTVPGTAVPPDFTPVTQTLTFAAGETAQSITVPINIDTLIEADETFTVVLNPVAGSTTTVGANDSASITITDTTPLPVVQFTAASTSINIAEDAGSAIVTIGLTGGVGPLTVDIASTNGTAVAGADFDAVAQTVTIPAGQTSIDLPITVNPDALIEGAEFFTLSLTVPAGVGAELGPNATSTVMIEDATVPGVIEFATPSLFATVNEDDAVVVLDLVLTGTPVASSVDVILTDGSAEAPGDFDGTSQTVVFAMGEISSSVSIPVNADSVIEEPESFTVTLVPTPGSGTLVGTNAVAEVTIADTTVIPPTVEIAAASTSLTVDETTDSATLILELTGGSGPATVEITTVDGSAISPADYVGFSQAVTIGAGENQVEVPVTINADADIEGIETFTVQLAPIAGNTTLVGESDSATISIVDATPPASVDFATDSLNVSVAEEAATVTLDLVLTGTPLAASVDAVLTAISATAGEDFVAATQTIVFSAGEIAQQLSIQINGDDQIEGVETFSVTLTPTPGSGTLIGGNSVSTVSITDSTVLTPVVAFAATSSSVSVDEASAGTTLTLELIEGVGPASVNLTTVDGTATAASGDFDAVSQVVTIPAGSNSVDVVIAINPDAEIEDAEIFTVQLSAVDETTEIGAPALATITIVDSTIPGVVEFAEPSQLVAIQEDSTSVTLALELNGTAVPASVDIILTDAGATAGEDFDGATQTVTFAAGVTTASVTINIVDDQLVEGNEAFVATLAPTPGSGTLVGEDDVSQVTIIDTTVLGPTVQIAAESVSIEIDESQGAVTLVLDVTSGSIAGSVLLTPVADTATAGEDFAVDSIVVEVPVGAESIPVTIPIVADGAFEAAEQFSIILQANADLTMVGENAASTVTIVDATNAGTLQFSLTDVQTQESSGELEIVVNRLGGVEADVSVEFAAENGSAINNEDFILEPGQLIWPAGDSNPRTITVQLINDSQPEATESFGIQLFNATPIGDDVQLGTPSSVNVQILDDGDDVGRIRFVSARTDGVDEASATVTVQVERIEGFSGNVMVDYETRPGSAAADVDFVSQSGRLVWEANEGAALGEPDNLREIVIDLIDDSEAEAAEEFSIVLVQAFPVSTEEQLADPFIHIVQLADDQANAGSLAFSSESVVGAEGDTVELTVQREGGTEGPAFVSYRVSGGSATTSEDFVFEEGRLSWDAGDGSVRTISLNILDDGIPEGEEFLVVELFEAGPVGDEAQLNANSSVTIVIPEQLADPGLLAFELSEVTVNEEDGSVRLLVNRTGGSDLRVSATFTTQDGTAVAGADFVANTGDVVWGPGDLEPKEIVIELVNDTLPEDTELFSVQLDNARPLGDELQFGANLIAEVSIIDSDLAAPLNDTVVTENPFRLEALGPLEQNADVGDQIENLGFRVVDSRLDGAVAEQITVLWSVEPAGAVEFPDGTVTVSDSDGLTTNRVVVTGTGFIRVIAEAQFESTEALHIKGLPQISSRIDTPLFEVPDGQAFFTLRVGLEAAPGITSNQSEIGRGLDNACLELNGIASTASLQGNVNDAGAALAPSAQQDLIDTCNALEASDNLAQDLDRVSHEELFVFSDTVVDTSDLQVTNVYSRINALRSGSTEGLDLSGLRFSILDETIPGNVVNAAQNALYGLATGGGAAAESGGFGKRLGFFANGAIGFGEVDGQGQQQNANVETTGLTVGADYRLTDRFVLGAGVGLVNSETEFTSSDGGATVDGVSFTLFGTWFKSDVGYFDVVLDAGTNSYEVERQINLTSDENEVMAIGETDASYISFTLGAGRNFTVADWELGPYVRYSATRASVDGYSETASNQQAGFGSVLDVRSHDANSSLFSFGGQISKSVSTTKAVFVPQFRFEFETQTEGTKDGIPATFQADPNDTLFVLEGTERDTSYINYGLGSSVVVKGGHSGFMFIEGRAADDVVRQNWLKLGYRYEFR